MTRVRLLMSFFHFLLANMERKEEHEGFATISRTGFFLYSDHTSVALMETRKIHTVAHRVPMAGHL